MTEQQQQEHMPDALTSGVPKVRAQSAEAAPKTRKVTTWMMIACCVPMVAGAGILIWGMGSSAGWSERIYTLAPLGLCLGVHLLMHKFMGKSCHGKNDTSKTKEHSDEIGS